MEPGRKIDVQSWEPFMFSISSAGLGRVRRLANDGSSGASPTGEATNKHSTVFRQPKAVETSLSGEKRVDQLAHLLEPHSVRVAVLVVALVLVAVAGGDPRLAHDDHA